MHIVRGREINGLYKRRIDLIINNYIIGPTALRMLETNKLDVMLEITLLQ